MPTYELNNQPKYKLVTIETDSVITESKLNDLIRDKQGITLCIRSKTGNENRGGYFFCIEKNSNDDFKLLTMESIVITESIALSKLTRLINHASGLAFDDNILHYCQNEINFRED